MTSRLAWYFKAKRVRLGLTIEALAAHIGPRHVKKTIRRLLRFEQDGHCPDTFLVIVAEALNIDYTVVLDLMERDTRAQMGVAGPHVAAGGLCHPQTAQGRPAALEGPEARKPAGGWIL